MTDDGPSSAPPRTAPAERRRPAAPGRWSVLLAAAGLAAIWAAAVVIRAAQPHPGPVDRSWDALMAASTGPVAHAVAAALAVVGTGLPGTALAVVLGVAIGAVRGRVWGALIVAASILSALDVGGMKALAHRARPDVAFGSFNAFPSGHTAYAALLGALVLLLVRHVAARCAAVAWIVAMAWSRTALHAHWLTDVLAAIVVGASTAVLLVAATSGVLRSRATAGADPGLDPAAG